MRALRDLWIAACIAIVCGTHEARAQDAAEPADESLLPPRGIYLHLMGGASWGKGLRFNNPFRLATPLGDTEESVSATAGYLNLAGSVSSGNPSGLLHGGSLALSVATDGIPQEVLTPAYQLSLRLPPHFLTYARAGLPLVLRPDPNIGYELGLGGVYWLSAGIGASFELIGSLFYGAATQDTAATAIPILSGQLGLTLSYEVLP